ncbi:MAG: hypothetical protein ACRDTM_00770 [Micromonosporaceae bacterium]
MEVRAATEASPDATINEDYAVVAPDFVAVLDGVTVPAGVDTGCAHGPAWYVRRLGAHLMTVHGSDPTALLSDVLAAAIEAVRGDHGATCDLEHPGTPQSTVCMLRTRRVSVDYLVLCDSPLVLDRGGTVEVITDMRLQQTRQRLREAAVVGVGAFGSVDRASRLRELVTSRHRQVNRQGGYWIAAANPAAAHQALTGTVPHTGPLRLRRAALLTDGASRAVDTFGLFDWSGLLDVLDRQGPRHLISIVRAAERADADGHLSPRHKRHDDATAVHCDFVRED